MVTHKDRLVILSFISSSPYQNVSTESPNQSIADMIESQFADIFDETRLIERYRAEDENDDDQELIDLRQALENESTITFTTGSDGYNDTVWSTFSTQRETAPSTELLTTINTPPPSTIQVPTKRSDRNKHGKKNGHKGHGSKERLRDRGRNSDEIDARRFEVKSDREYNFERFFDPDLPPIFEGTKPADFKPSRKQSKSNRNRPVQSSEEDDQILPTRVPNKPKQQSKESSIHHLKPERVPENALPSTPVSTNSKIIEIKPSQGTKNLSRKSRQHSDADLEFEIQSVDEDDFIIRDEETGEVIRPEYLMGVIPENISLEVRELEGIAGLIQRILESQDTFDQTKWHHVPSLEFINFALALLVWSVKYPSVFWAASKPFATIFSIMMTANTLDILLCYAGVSVLYKHEVVGDPLPIHVSLKIVLGTYPPNPSKRITNLPGCVANLPHAP